MVFTDLDNLLNNEIMTNKLENDVVDFDELKRSKKNVDINEIGPITFVEIKKEEENGNF